MNTESDTRTRPQRPAIPPVIAVVVPCYNEQDALPISLGKLTEVIELMVRQGSVSKDSFVLCVDDGSADRTWEIIARAHDADQRIKGVALAHNRGHQYALLAGLMTPAGGP